MFGKARHGNALHRYAHRFEKFSTRHFRWGGITKLEERSEMSFPVPETSRKGHGRMCPLNPRTHALCRNCETMARPTKHEKRDKQLNLKLTRREFDYVCARAKRRALRPVDFARGQLLSERPVRTDAPRGHLDPLFLLQLSRLGNNLNQIARRLNVMRMGAPEGLVPLLEEIRGLIRKGAADGP
jgi:hypothetical protein